MGDDGRDNADNPGVITPPFIYAGALSAGLLANWLFRISFLPRRLARPRASANHRRVRGRVSRIS
jgi:hypothetical protein